VKVSRLGTKTVEVTLEDDATVADALAAAEVELGSTEKVSVNGERADMRTVLEDEDKVFIAKDAKSA
jgi:hypothetical protein